MAWNAEALTEQLARGLLVELEASGRHVHVTKEQAQQLFGHDLTVRRPLSQPGQYLAEERMTLLGPGGSLRNVAVLGPCRKTAQAELSLTDARALGLQPPIRLSGDTAGSAPITLEGPLGRLELPEGAIIAKRHIHMTPEDAAARGLRDGQTVKLRTLTRRPLTFSEVTVRVRPDFCTYAHLDYDEANACGLLPGDLGMIVP